MRRALLIVPILVLGMAPPRPAIAQRGPGPVLHEPIAFDARDDIAAGLSLDGDFSPGIEKPGGIVPAPNPSRPIAPGESSYGTNVRSEVPDASFRPDRDTRRPDTLPYDDPFSPSTAPFKRLSVFDTVDANYTLSVRNPHPAPLAISPTPPPFSSEEQFFADIVVDLVPGKKVRIPSVGPAARVLRARAAAVGQDVKFQLFRDGAENWFIEGETQVRARLVMELSVPRAGFGGDFGAPSWADLLPVAPLAPVVDRAAAEVASRIGVSKRLSPRDNVTKLVAYFRSFTESDEPPTTSRDIYLDLALSRKGVCRHRAFAFLVTAIHLGLPTRMVVNEAHAWVEVFDGRLWRRIDLGGAGRTLHDPLSPNVPYEPPSDAFAWPQGASRGDDLAQQARRPPPATSAPGSSGAPGAAGSAGPAGSSGTGPLGSSGNGGPGGPGARFVPSGPDERPASALTMALGGNEARRGAPLHVKGTVSAEGDACAHVSVEIVLRGKNREEIPVGLIATDDNGGYDGAIVLPPTVPTGDYEVSARTFGDTRCGRGQTK